MTDTIEPVYTGKYTDSNSVLALFEDISDEPSDALLTVAIDNTEAWIESNLKRHYVPIPTDIPQTLKTIAIYYASSDILMSLYHGEEYQTLMDYWFNKAQDLLDAYIEEYLNSDARITSVGMPARDSIRYFPVREAWYDVPHATKHIL